MVCTSSGISQAAACSSPAMANRRTIPVAANVFHTARPAAAGCYPAPGPHMSYDRPPVTPGDLAHYRGRVLARLQRRLCPREAQPQQFQQFGAFMCASAAPILAAAAAFGFVVLMKRMTNRRLRCARRFPNCKRQDVDADALRFARMLAEHMVDPMARHSEGSSVLREPTATPCALLSGNSCSHAPGGPQMPCPAASWCISPGRT